MLYALDWTIRGPLLPQQLLFTQHKEKTPKINIKEHRTTTKIINRSHLTEASKHRISTLIAKKTKLQPKLFQPSNCVNTSWPEIKVPKQGVKHRYQIPLIFNQI